MWAIFLIVLGIVGGFALALFAQKALREREAAMKARIERTKRRK